MQKLAEQARPDVEVTISHELRALLSERRAAFGSEAAATGAEAETHPTPVPEATDSGPEWQNILLRRDGDRPLSFSGLPVIGVEDRLVVDGRAAAHRLDLFCDGAGQIFASLRFVPEDDHLERPVFRSSAFADADGFAEWFRNWRQTALPQEESEQCLLPSQLAASLNPHIAQYSRTPLPARKGK